MRGHGKSLREVADALNADSVPSRRGDRWHRRLCGGCWIAELHKPPQAVAAWHGSWLQASAGSQVARC
jgi:hypothetical protein